MKKSGFIVFLLFCLVSSYASDLKYGEAPITKKMKLGINQTAVDSGAFIQWQLKGPWDKFDYSFSQGELDSKNHTFTVYASEYKDSVNGEVGIVLTVNGKKKTEGGEYTLEMEVVKASDNLKIEKDKFHLLLPVKYQPYQKTVFEILLPYLIILAVILLLLLVLHVTAKFPRGLLQLGQDSVKLKGKKRISLKEELEKLDVTLAEGTDVILVKKRFGAFQGPCIKEMKKCDLERDGEYLTPGSIIHFEEEIKGLRDINGNDIIIIYV